MLILKEPRLGRNEGALGAKHAETFNEWFKLEVKKHVLLSKFIEVLIDIFNSKYVLASPETASDADYTDILRVIGHETFIYFDILQYFHNWTGNRLAHFFQFTQHT
ncbi:hypothetical protein IFM89_009697 [Coptis chinensis]|uniref:Uncharacterized protein n=1 Tax=Coptis chinensis TaxID=261450 RepID=A0A835HPT3_9MAGN|nr:hypothetical protein IFM89_009697 [Coptis chinensis]